MAKPPKRDKSILYTVAAAFLLLVAGFAFVWFYQRHAADLRSRTVYSKPLRVVAAARNYSVAASFAVRVSGADADWVADNRRALEQVMQQALTTGDARAALTPGGLRALQESLRRAGNAALHTDKIQQVLITDFLVSDSSD